jgi:hypothetical protein
MAPAAETQIVGQTKTMPDRQAVQTLLKRHWRSSESSSNSQESQDAEIEHAKRCGVMFEDLQVDHDEVVARLTHARDALNPLRVAKAFVASLSTRRLDLRSALGSFAVFRHLPPHRADFVGKMCSICGLWEPSPKPEDLNVLNFERFKWGGVRHDQPLYAALDLDLFLKEDDQQPTESDIELLRDILAALRSCPPSTTSAQASDALPRSLRSNKAERNVVLTLLGFCGIISTAEHPGYRERFIPPQFRPIPSRRFVDMPYPACWWRASNGFDSNAISEYFGSLL